MNYHNITTDDMLNGEGLRTVLWVAGCDHHCFGCQNPVTWKPDGGIFFDSEAKDELFDKLDRDYISGVTFSGGDPLYLGNRREVLELCKEIKFRFHGTKTVWLYTGYLWEDIKDIPGIKHVDVLVDGEYIKGLNDANYHWCGSTNQRVIDVKRSLEIGSAVIYKEDE